MVELKWRGGICTPKKQMTHTRALFVWGLGGLTGETGKRGTRKADLEKKRET